MAFPNVSLKTKNLTLTPELLTHLEKRLATLERLLPKRGAAMVCDVELSKTTKHHQSGKIFRAEFNLKINNDLLRAEATEETIENAIDHAKNELKRELDKRSSKGKDVARKGARTAKAMTQRGK